MRTSKIFVLILTCLFIYTDSNAQRIKDDRVKLNYNRLPSAPLSTDFTTYSTSINSTQEALSSVGFTEKVLADKYLTLRAFKKLQKGGHFHINVEVNPIRIVQSKAESNTISSKDKNGNVKKTTTYYQDVAYNTPVTFTMEDKDGNVIEQQIYGSSAEGTKYQFKNGKTGFKSKAELAKAWSNRGNTFTKMQKASIQKSFETFSTLIKRKYDTSKDNVMLAIQIPAGKKVANADDFAANAADAIKVIKAIKSDVAIDAAKKDLQPMIDFWTTQKDNFSADNKKEVKVHHACLYNLAVANLVIENMEEAVTYADLAVATKKKKSASNSLKSFVTGQQKVMQDANATTLHFPLDLSTATAPEGVDYKKFEPKEVVAAPKIVAQVDEFDGYFMTTKGDSLVGTYVFPRGLGENPKFHSQGQIKFVYDKNGSPVELSLSPAKFKMGSFNGRTFKVMRRRVGMSLDKTYFAVEVIESGAKMNLLRLYPMDKRKDGSLPKAQTLIKVRGKKGYRNVGDIANPKFVNWKKGFASLFQDCAALNADVLAGKYERDLASMVEAIHLYNTNSCN